MSIPYVFVNVREVVRSRRGLYEVLSRALSDFLRRYSPRRALVDKVVRALGGVRGVRINGFEAALNWGKDRPLVGELFREFDRASGDVDVRPVIVIDEARRLGEPVGFDVQNAVAHAYDFLDNLLFVISGSEVGVLGSILGNPESPLFSRAYAEVTTRRLSCGESLKLLRRGFSEVGIDVDEHEIESAMDRLDGIIGWLTYYCYSRSIGGRDLDSIVSDAVGMARQELEDFLKSRASRRCRVVLRLLASGIKEQGLLKRRLEDYEGSRISDRVFHDILTALKRHSIIDDLDFTDPVVREAARGL